MRQNIEGEDDDQEFGEGFCCGGGCLDCEGGCLNCGGGCLNCGGGDIYNNISNNNKFLILMQKRNNYDFRK